MTILKAIEVRHSVRSYLDKPIPMETVAALNEEISLCNKEGDLHIQMVTKEPRAFDGFMAHYGKFSGVQNYIALIGKKCNGLDERLGYYGERIALKAQSLGLNTCWVAMSVSKGVVRKNCTVASDEKLICVQALGYGTTQGEAHKSKTMEELCRVSVEMPDWFRTGMEAAMLAPTAMNQQKFRMVLSDGMVKAENLGGFYSKIDLGIIKYHFEIGAGKDNFKWA